MLNPDQSALILTTVRTRARLKALAKQDGRTMTAYLTRLVDAAWEFSEKAYEKSPLASQP